LKNKGDDWLKLYKAHNADVSIDGDVLVFWAEDHYSAMVYVREKELNHTKAYIFDDMSLNEVLEEIGNEKIQDDFLVLLGKNDFDDAARLFWAKVFYNEWTVEEITDYPKDKEIYVCYPQFLSEVEDVEIVYINKNEPIESVFSELVLRESKHGGFRDFVLDASVNMSFNERFYCDEKGWVFDPRYRTELDYREDIKEKAKAANKTVDRFVDEFWLSNVNEFFKDNYHYEVQFKKYCLGLEIDFDDNFFFYVCNKLMSQGDWTKYDIRKVSN
jgi:hypothetical protein